VTRTIGASQSGTLDGGPVTWTPPGVSGFAHDIRPCGTRVDFDVKVTEEPRSTSSKEVSSRFRLAEEQPHEGVVPVTALRRKRSKLKTRQTIPGGRYSKRFPVAEHGDRTGSDIYIYIYRKSISRVQEKSTELSLIY